jgi:hypothetical protein
MDRGLSRNRRLLRKQKAIERIEGHTGGRGP